MDIAILLPSFRTGYFVILFLPLRVDLHRRRRLLSLCQISFSLFFVAPFSLLSMVIFAILVPHFHRLCAVLTPCCFAFSGCFVRHWACSRKLTARLWLLHRLQCIGRGERGAGGVGGCGEYFGHVYAVFRLLKAVCVCLLQEGVPGYVLLPAKSELLRFLLRHPFIIPSSHSRVQHGRCSPCKYYHQIYKMSHR